MITLNLLRQYDVPYKRAGSEVRVCCPICHDVKFHLYFSLDRQVGWCHRCSTPIPKRRFAQLFQLPITTNLLDDLETQVDSLTEQYKLKPLAEDIQTVTERIVLPPATSSLKNPEALAYLRRRRVSRDQIKRYHIGYCQEGYWNHRIVIPVYRSGELLSFLARSINGSSPKYLYPKGSKIHTTFFGWDQYAQSSEVILVEGIFDFFAVEKFKPCLCLFGKHITEAQLQLLRDNLAIKTIILMLDGDVSYEEVSNLATKLKPFCRVKIARLPFKTDPAEYIDSLSKLESVLELPCFDF